VPQKSVRIARDNSVATLTLARAPLNLLNIDLMEQVNTILLGLREHTELKVLVIRGEGKAFCAGLDIADHTRDRVARMLQVFHRIFEALRMLDVISVAAVDGIAFGGGFQLAIGCNLILASASARFALPEIKVGTFPALACVVLPRAGPRRKAMEWILTGDEIPAEELRLHGLVNRVYPDAEFEQGLAEFVAKLSSKSAPVLQLAKRAQLESNDSGYEEALSSVENLYLRELMPLADVKEGITSFLEKREPVWKNA
jgi:cyclohexa-1,5-dienecarbonyl-CoA hydratase